MNRILDGIEKYAKEGRAIDVEPNFNMYEVSPAQLALLATRAKQYRNVRLLNTSMCSSAKRALAFRAICNVVRDSPLLVLKLGHVPVELFNELVDVLCGGGASLQVLHFYAGDGSTENWQQALRRLICDTPSTLSEIHTDSGFFVMLGDALDDVEWKKIVIESGVYPPLQHGSVYADAARAESIAFYYKALLDVFNLRTLPLGALVLQTVAEAMLDGEDYDELSDAERTRLAQAAFVRRQVRLKRAKMYLTVTDRSAPYFKRSSVRASPLMMRMTWLASLTYNSRDMAAFGKEEDVTTKKAAKKKKTANKKKKR